MSETEPRRIDWSSATTHEATLKVKLSGPREDAWSARFENVIALLGSPHSRWGEVRLTKKGIRVAAVEPGAEEDLRHLLESAVAQANSDLAPAREAPTAELDPLAERDLLMTERFRSFAEQRQEQGAA